MGNAFAPAQTVSEKLEQVDPRVGKVDVTISTVDPLLGVRVTSTSHLIRRAPKRWRGTKIMRVLEVGSVPDSGKISASTTKDQLKSLLTQLERSESHLEDYLHELAEEEEDREFAEPHPRAARRSKRARVEPPPPLVASLSPPPLVAAQAEDEPRP